MVFEEKVAALHISAGLAALHKGGMSHGDLKPQNGEPLAVMSCPS